MLQLPSQFQDAHNWAFASLYFVTFTIIGAFFLLQFVFAVIWERFTAVNDGTAENWDLILAERVASVKTQPSKSTLLDTAPAQGRSEKHSKVGIGATVRNGIQSTIQSVKTAGLKERLRELCHTIANVSVWRSKLSLCLCYGDRANSMCRALQDPFFGAFIVVCILLNTVCLAMDEYPADEHRDLVTEHINTVLTIIFIVEMGLKLAGLGVKEYCADNYNLFDGGIVLVSLVEMTMNAANPDSKNNSGLSALRSFRFFRIMKLARSWKSLRELLVTVGMRFHAS